MSDQITVLLKEEKPSKIRLLQELFEQLLPLSQDERDLFLKRQCHDEALRSKLSAMLAVPMETQQILNSPVYSSFVQKHECPAKHWIGKWLDDCIVTEVLGKGGMGVVYKGHQEGALSRDVAIKMVHPGAPEDFYARFRFEQAALAKLNHPNIATVYSVGNTQQHLPYLVMEYVEGETLLDHCDAHQLSMLQRLSLFLGICEGIAYSHQRGILHRDIKPGNILVRRLETGPIPKVIDFGISSHSVPKLSNNECDLRLSMATPEYSSPEHFLDGNENDVRADVYSLGMLLLSLLTGKLRFPREDFSVLTPEQQQDWLARNKPESISIHSLCQPNELQNKQAKSFGITVKQWRKQLSREIDWIYIKATAIDKNQRYGSANELASDIKRYLSNQAIVAAPDNKVYQITKIIQRNKILAASTLLITSMLLIFSANTEMQNRKIEQQYQLSEQQKLAAEEAKLISEQTTELMVELFQPNPTSDPTDPQTFMQATEAAYQRLKNKSDIPPGVRYRLLVEIANLLSINQNDELARKILSPILSRNDFPSVEMDIRANAAMAGAYKLSNKFDLNMHYAQTAFNLATSQSDDKSLLLRATQELSWAYYNQEDFDSSLKYSQQAWEISKNLHGKHDVITLREQVFVGYYLFRLKQYDAAEKLLSDALQIHEGLPVPDENVLMENKLYLTYVWGEAEHNIIKVVGMKESLERDWQAKHGTDSRNHLMFIKWTLISSYYQAGMYQDVLNKVHYVNEMMSKHGYEHFDNHEMIARYAGLAYLALGQFEEAEQSLNLWREERLKRFPDNPVYESAFIELYLRSGQLVKAGKYAEEALKYYDTQESFTQLLPMYASLYYAHIQEWERAEELANQASEDIRNNATIYQSKLHVAQAISAFCRYMMSNKSEHKMAFELHLNSYRQFDTAYPYFSETLNAWYDSTI